MVTRLSTSSFFDNLSAGLHSLLTLQSLFYIYILFVFIICFLFVLTDYRKVKEKIKTGNEEIKLPYLTRDASICALSIASLLYLRAFIYYPFQQPPVYLHIVVSILLLLMFILAMKKDINIQKHNAKIKSTTNTKYYKRLFVIYKVLLNITILTFIFSALERFFPQLLYANCILICLVVILALYGAIKTFQYYREKVPQSSIPRRRFSVLDRINEPEFRKLHPIISGTLGDNLAFFLGLTPFILLVVIVLLISLF